MDSVSAVLVHSAMPAPVPLPLRPSIGIRAAVLLAALAPQLWKLQGPVAEIFSAGFISDDAFYYYKTAVHLRRGLGSTFDGLNWTNGYHPLWMAVCVAVSSLVRDSEGYVRAVLGANLVCVAALTWRLMGRFWPSLGWGAALAALLLNWNAASASIVFSGMETPLYLLLTLMAVERLIRLDTANSREALGLGAVFGLAFLARTEFVLFGPIAAFHLLLRCRREGAWRPLRSALFILPPFLLCAMPYLIWNYVHTGHFQQISGLVKNLRPPDTFDSLRSAARAVHAYGRFFGAALGEKNGWGWALPATLAVAGAAARRRAPAAERRPALWDDPIWRMSALFGLVTVAYYFFSYGSGFRHWHFGMAVVALQLGLLGWAFPRPIASEGAPRRAWAWPIAAAVLMLGFQAPQIPRSREMRRQTNYRFAASIDYADAMARWVRANLPKDAVIGTWNAGYFGYFSERTVVNLDGLINGIELYDRLRDEGGVWRFIEEHRLQYLSDYWFGDPEPLRSPLADRLELVHRIGPSRVDRGQGPTTVDWYLWRLRPPG